MCDGIHNEMRARKRPQGLARRFDWLCALTSAALRSDSWYGLAVGSTRSMYTVQCERLLRVNAHLQATKVYA